MELITWTSADATARPRKGSCEADLKLSHLLGTPQRGEIQERHDPKGRAGLTSARDHVDRHVLAADTGFV